jgi:hypothetical protein
MMLKTLTCLFGKKYKQIGKKKDLKSMISIYRRIKYLLILVTGLVQRLCTVPESHNTFMLLKQIQNHMMI